MEVPTISIDITLLLDISKSMKQQDCQITESYVFEFFELSPRTIDEQFLLELRAALANKRIRRSFAMDILAQVIKEKLTDGVWNLGYHPATILISNNLNLSIIDVGKADKEKIESLKELCTIGRGVYIHINDINRKSIKQVDLIENWILTS